MQLSFYSVNWFYPFVPQNQSPPEQYVGNSVSLGQRVVSYPIHFVTGAIGNIFNNGGSKEDKNKIKQLEAKNQKLETENKKV